MNTQKIYDRITDVIIEMLEQHKKSNYTSAWYNLSGDSLFAQNRATKHTYSGINQLMLQYLRNKYNYSFNGWLTFKQLDNLGGKIKKVVKPLQQCINHIYIQMLTRVKILLQ